MTNSAVVETLNAHNIHAGTARVVATKRAIAGHGWGKFGDEFGDQLVAEVVVKGQVPLDVAEQLLADELNARIRYC